MYHQASLDAAWDLAKGWSVAEMEALRRDVASKGFKAEIAGRTVQAIAGELLGYAREGLGARGNHNSTGEDETLFLATLEDSVARCKTPAEDLLDRYHGEWNENLTKIFRECAF